MVEGHGDGCEEIHSGGTSGIEQAGMENGDPRVGARCGLRHAHGPRSRQWCGHGGGTAVPARKTKQLEQQRQAHGGGCGGIWYLNLVECLPCHYHGRASTLHAPVWTPKGWPTVYKGLRRGRMHGCMSKGKHEPKLLALTLC